MQRSYFVALVEFLRQGLSPTQREVATVADIDPTLVSKWNRSERFGEEVERLECRHLAFAIERAHRGMLRAAEKGNHVAYVAAMETLERQGRVAVVNPANGANGGGANVGANDLGGVHFHVHGVPERQPLSSLPPTLTLPAPSAAAPVTPAPAK
jgi:hypothetical protein